MSVKWTKWGKGYVRVQIRGDRLEQVLNRMMEERSDAWDVIRSKHNILEVSISLSEYRQWRTYLDENEYEVSVLQRGGLPFLLSRAKRQMGMVIGMLVFISIIIIASMMLWRVDIEGIQDPQNKEKLVQALHESGLKVGTFKYQLADSDTIKRIILQKIPELTWIGIDIRGTTVTVRALEKTFPEISAAQPPQHLVAQKKAVVQRMFVEQGQPLVRLDQYVEPGDVLVSGQIGTKEHPLLVHAAGQIIGEVWYESTITVPLRQVFEKLSGQSHQGLQVNFGVHELPLWGNRNIPFDQYHSHEQVYAWHIGAWRIPISFTKITYYERLVKEEQAHTEEAAYEWTKALGREQMKRNLPIEAEIIDENVLKKEVENGKVYMKMHYTVLEEISTGQSITQGE